MALQVERASRTVFGFSVRSFLIILIPAIVIIGSFGLLLPPGSADLYGGILVIVFMAVAFPLGLRVYAYHRGLDFKYALMGVLIALILFLMGGQPIGCL